MSSKNGYVKTSIPFINKLFKYKIFIILSNWTFQGMLYADKTERTFRIMIDIVIAIVLYSVFFHFILNTYLLLFLSLLVAHTFNWIFNGQLFVLSRYIGIKPNKQHLFNVFLQEFKSRAEREKSIKTVVVYGSLSRGSSSETSDLDIRVIRKSGFTNGLRACIFGFLERLRAFFNKFPLDLYVIDGLDSLSKMRGDEYPIIVYDPQNVMSKIIQLEEFNV
jgi:predicted nucleotidyltransferase